jgi:hypothetical protein
MVTASTFCLVLIAFFVALFSEKRVLDTELTDYI